MSGIVMYDAINLSQIPADAPAAAGYVDGHWPTYARLRGMFPRAHLLSIAVTAASNADCLDIETGDATPASAAAWYERQKGRVTRPCLYASASVMQADVVPVIQAAGIPRAAVRLWSAHYTGTPHICGPATCRAMSISADGTQWTNAAFGRDLDESLLAADFFAAPAPAPVPPKPAPDPLPAWQEALMNKLPVLAEGAEDKAGQVFWVHRAQALTQAYGQFTDTAAAACQMVTGTFDAATVSAVKAVQEHARITADGICGKDTWSVLITGSAA
jgi:peptidoglycan hydrolase-like protein with peptidoglycan-binding domain